MAERAKIETHDAHILALASSTRGEPPSTAYLVSLGIHHIKKGEGVRDELVAAKFARVYDHFSILMASKEMGLGAMLDIFRIHSSIKNPTAVWKVPFFLLGL